ncbi:hypothetical protein ABWH98_24760 [Labrenzia sp. ac12]
MKVLLLDSLEQSAGRISELSVLQDALKEHDAECICYSINGQMGVDPGAFARQFKTDIDDAALIVGLGNYLWVKYFNDALGVYDHLINAISSGKPFVFQSVRGWEKFYAYLEDPGNPFVRSLFKSVGVMPTPVKVFTDDSPTNVGGGAVAFFRAGDNCFLNADVLGETDELLLGQPNILNFERGVFPVVETGPLHELVDERDRFTKLQIDVRPAVFVEVRNAAMRGFFISGNLLRDGYDAIGGHVPGAEINKTAISALIEKALNWKKKGPSFEIALYQDLYDFERGLGNILRARLPDHESRLLAEAELRHLIDMACQNWRAISDLFDYANMAEFSHACSAIPAGVRRYVSHPIRLNYEPDAISPEAAQHLKKAAEAVRNATDRLGHHPMPT